MIESPYDMFAKEYKTCFPVYGMIQASSAKPKTPYQLDLEVKDRKPSIVPKVGDRVKIKSREWYEKWKDTEGRVWIDNAFVPPMVDFCGKILKIRSGIGSFYSLEGNGWSWHPGMFEEVYPVQEQLSSKFPRIDLSCHLPLQSPYEVKGNELVLSKEEQERLKQQLREKWEVKPKLKQVKTTHLIKLKKL